MKTFRSHNISLLIGIVLVVCAAMPSVAFAQETLNKNDIGNFLFLVALVLLPSYGLAWVCRRLNLPEYLGAIIVGLCMGKSGLGHIAPEVHNAIFSNTPGFISMIMLTSFIGASTLLFDAGLAVNLDTISRWKKECFTIGVIGLCVSLVTGMLILTPAHAVMGINQDQPLLVPLIVISLMSIAPLSLIFKLLDECLLLGSEVASLKLGASAIGEIVALLFVSIIAAVCAGTTGIRLYLMFPALGLAMLTLRYGPLIEKLIRMIGYRGEEEHSIAVRAIVIIVSIFGAYFSFFKLPIIFGFFIAGVLLNATSLVTGHLRHLFTRVAHQAWVPFFFAACVFEIDFFTDMNVGLMLLYSVTALIAKGLVTLVLCRYSGLTHYDSRLTAASFVPMAVGGIALAGNFYAINILSSEIYTAFLGATVVTTILGGILFTFLVGHSRKVPFVEILDRELIELKDVDATLSSKQQLEELLSDFSKQKAKSIDLTPEEMLKHIHTDHDEIGYEMAAHGFVAVHMHCKKLSRARLIFARSRQGMDLPSLYGNRTHFIALLALPDEEDRDSLEVAIWPVLVDFLEHADGSKLLSLEAEEVIDTILISRPNEIQQVANAMA